MDSGYRLFIKRQGLDPATEKRILSRSNKLVKACDPFCQKTVDEYLVKLSDKYTNSTVNKYIQAVKKICAYKQLDWGKNVTCLKNKPPRRPTMSDSEIEALISLENGIQKYNVFWSVVAYTGARPGEILRLRVEDINQSDHTIEIKDNKSRQYRIVPIPEIIRRDLYSYIKTIEDKLWTVSYTSILKDFHKRVDQLGIKKKVTPYALRHSFITRMVSEVDLFDVQGIVGHKKANTTQQYVHKNLKTKRKAIKKDPLSRRSLSEVEILEQIKQRVTEELETYELAKNKKIDFSINETKTHFELEIHIDEG